MEHARDRCGGEAQVEYIYFGLSSILLGEKPGLKKRSDPPRILVPSSKLDFESPHPYFVASSVMRTTSRSSSAENRGQWRCVDRPCPRTLHARLALHRLDYKAACKDWGQGSLPCQEMVRPCCAGFFPCSLLSHPIRLRPAGRRETQLSTAGEGGVF